MFKEILDFIKNNKWYVLLVIGLLGLYFYQFHGGLSTESEKWDHFGSYIGGIFSAVTLLSVLHGMQLERKRFNDQKIEFESEKKEQEDRRRKEDFERTFFMMLEQHNTKLKNLESLMLNKKEVRLIDKYYEYILSEESFSKLRNDLSKNDKLYSEIDSYSITLYRVLKFIHKNMELNVDYEYSGLLRSFLSRKMLVILAFNICNREEQYGKYIDCINKLFFFEHLSLDELELRFISFISGLEYDKTLDLMNKLKDKIENLHELIEYENEDGEVEFASSLYSIIENDILSRNLEYSIDSSGEEICTYSIKDCMEMISVDTILNILIKRHNDIPLEESDFKISDKYKDIGMEEDEYGEVHYIKFHRVENMDINSDTLFINVLSNFSSEAFSDNPKEKFENLKKIYGLFIKREN